MEQISSPQGSLCPRNLDGQLVSRLGGAVKVAKILTLWRRNMEGDPRLSGLTAHAILYLKLQVLHAAATQKLRV